MWLQISFIAAQRHASKFPIRDKVFRLEQQCARRLQRHAAADSRLDVQRSVRNLYCPGVSGTTESLPCRTSGESAKSLFALISPSVMGLARDFPASISTAGFLGSERSTERSEAVPTALLRSPVS